jgi:hypothetical protein
MEVSNSKYIEVSLAINLVELNKRWVEIYINLCLLIYFGGLKMNRCRICGKILEDETEDICLDCQSFIIDEF